MWVFCSFSFLQYVGIKGVISSDALAKCYDWPHIHKPVSLITQSVTDANLDKRKKGNLVFRLIWFDAISSHTQTHTPTNTCTHSSPQIVTGSSGWEKPGPTSALRYLCVLGRICLKTSVSQSPLTHEGRRKVVVAVLRWGQNHSLSLLRSESSWCVAWTGVCGLYCTSLEMVFLLVEWRTTHRLEVIHNISERVINWDQTAGVLQRIEVHEVSLQFTCNSSGSFVVHHIHIRILYDATK